MIKMVVFEYDIECQVSTIWSIGYEIEYHFDKGLFLFKWFYQFVGFTFGETEIFWNGANPKGVKHKQKSKLRIYLAQNGDYGGLPYPCLIQGVIFEALMKAERIKRIFRFLKTCKLKSRLMRDTLHENGDPFIFVVTLWWDGSIIIFGPVFMQKGHFCRKFGPLPIEWPIFMKKYDHFCEKWPHDPKIAWKLDWKSWIVISTEKLLVTNVLKKLS